MKSEKVTCALITLLGIVILSIALVVSAKEIGGSIRDALHHIEILHLYVE